MAVPLIQYAMNAGEISPSLFGRVDLAKYRAGCSTLRNFFVSYRGGATSRAGTLFCGQCKQDPSLAPPVLIPFSFSVTQSYALEFGEKYMRVVADGGYVTETPFAIQGITQANPGTIVAGGNDFAVGDWVYVSGVEGMVQINGGTFVVRDIPTTGSFTLNSTLDDGKFDTSGYDAYTTGGTVARIYTLETPYATADLPLLKWTQSADVMTLVNPNYAPRDLARIDNDNWTLTATTFDTSIKPPGTITASPTTTTSATQSTYYQFVVTAVDSLTAQESIASPIATVTNSVDIAEQLGAINVTWSAVSGAEYYNIYKAPPAFGGPVPVGALFGYAGSSFGLSFNDSNILQDMSLVPPQHFNPFAPGAIDYFVMSATGAGYTSVPLPSVIITDSTGTGAVGEAVVSADGTIPAIIVLDGGENYTNPQVQITGGGSGSGAVIIPTGNLDGEWAGSTSITSPGSGYTNPVVVAHYFGINQAASSVTLGGGGSILGVHFDPPADGTEPLSAVTITVGDSIGSGAAATAHVGPSTGTYPSCAAYFQQRRFYANTLNNPDTYYASQPGNFKNMDRSIPVTEGDAIIGTPWAQQVNGIQAMVPMPGGLVILTGLGAWQLSGGGQQLAVTPSNQVATAQAYNGCSPTIRPITVNYDILYVQEKGSVVRDLSYNFFVNIYTGTDMTVLSNHLFDGHLIVRWDWMEEPYKLVWAVRDDGILLSLTYLKEQDVYAWARHDTNGLFQSVCSVSEPPVNAPYFIVRRYVHNHHQNNPQWVYYTERMDNRLWTDIESAWCVDCALAYQPNKPDATLTVSSATGDQNITSYNIIDGGSNYTAPVGTVIDDTGTGAIVALVVTGGVITAANVIEPGAGYSSRPVLKITDTTGSGAKIQPIVTNYATFDASANVFAPENVGDIIRTGGGKAIVVQYTSPTEVVGNIIVPITAILPDDAPDNIPVPQPSGDWSISTPISTVYGLDHLEGIKVGGLADGGVVSPLLRVVNGSVTLPNPASSIVLGLPFTAQLQTLYLETPQGVTMQGRRKNLYEVNLRVENSRAPKVGSNQPDQSVQPDQASPTWTNLTQIQERNASVPAGLPMPLYTGDYFTGVFGTWDTHGQIAVQMDRPLPLTLLSLVPWIEVGDDPSGAQ